jgi:signal transduction histidine kinase
MFLLGFGMLVIVALVPTLAQRLGPAASRRLVLGLGVTAATVGWFTLVHIVWGPTYSVYQVSTSSDGGQSAVAFTRSLAEEGLSPLTRPDFVHRQALQSGELVQEVLEKARVLGEREWHPEISRTGTLRCDRQRITQAMLQLAENAAHHTGPGDAIHIGTDMEDGVVRLWVRDTGAGIPAEEQEAIFRRFYRATGSDRSKGTGLGLSIVRAIAEAHGGRATVTSRPGNGATFTLEIPTDDPARATDAR